MRPRYLGWAVLCILILASVPTSSHAMTVTANGNIRTSTPADCTAADIPAGGTASCVNLDAFASQGGTYSFKTCFGCVGPARAVISQSGSIVAITLKEVTITQTGLGGETQLQLIVQSSPGDLPQALFTCTCPAGTAASGFFGVNGSPGGDSLQVSSQAGAKIINGNPVNFSPASLPSACAGQGATAACSTFTPSIVVVSFSDSITEPINQSTVCDCGSPFLGGTITVTLNPLDTIDFPYSVAQLRPGSETRLDLLSGALVSPMAVAARLFIAPGGFALASALTLGAGSPGITPFEFVDVIVGDPKGTPVYAVTVPAGLFVRGPFSSLFFKGTIKGVPVAVQIVPLSTNALGLGVEAAANLTTITNPVPVAVTINSNHGSTNVTATFVRPEE